MRNLIMYRKGEDSWINWIKKRINHNLNFLALFEGPTGIGKSWGALSIAHAIDKDFNPRDQISFTFRDLMKIINNFNDKEHPLYKKKYKIIIFDETQIDLSNRAWQTKINKLFNYLLSTFRHQNIILLFTSPYSDFLDSASMKLLHCKFEIRGWNKKTNLTFIKPKLLQYNSKLKKFYEHSLHTIRDKKVQKISEWYVKRPPQEIVNSYEEMKTAFTQQLNRKITLELEGISTSPTDPIKEEKKIKKKGELKPGSLQPLIWDYVTKKGYKNQTEIADYLSVLLHKKVHLTHISLDSKRMRKQGYDIRKFKII